MVNNITFAAFDVRQFTERSCNQLFNVLGRMLPHNGVSSEELRMGFVNNLKNLPSKDFLFLTQVHEDVISKLFSNTKWDIKRSFDHCPNSSLSNAIVYDRSIWEEAEKKHKDDLPGFYRLVNKVTRAEILVGSLDSSLCTDKESSAVAMRLKRQSTPYLLFVSNNKTNAWNRGKRKDGTPDDLIRSQGNGQTFVITHDSKSLITTIREVQTSGLKAIMGTFSLPVRQGIRSWISGSLHNLISILGSGISKIHTVLGNVFGACCPNTPKAAKKTVRFDLERNTIRAIPAREKKANASASG